jgi:hypothetical protein
MITLKNALKRPYLLAPPFFSASDSSEDDSSSDDSSDPDSSDDSSEVSSSSEVTSSSLSSSLSLPRPQNFDACNIEEQGEDEIQMRV